MMRRMPRWVSAGVFSFCAALISVSAPVASGAAPRRAEMSVDVTFPDPVMSSICGTTVFERLAGTLKASVFLDQSGTPIREVDTQPSATITYTASATGRSISFPFAVVLHTRYPDGVSSGSPAVVTLTGNIGSLTGVAPAGSGRLVFNAVVLGVDQNGIPATQLVGAPISEQGNFTQRPDAICDALS
jgi:hypothetical protein